jgi:hypothetical protein
LECGLDAAQRRGTAGDTGVAGRRVVLESRAPGERTGKGAGIEIGKEAPVGEAVETHGGGVGIGYRPADVVVAANVSDP